MKRFAAAAVMVAALAAIVWWSLPQVVVTGWTRVQRLRAGFHERVTVTVDGAMPYLIGGQGPDLVLLHGFQDSKDSWIPFARLVMNRRRVIIPDLAGHGANRSDAHGDYRPDAQAARVVHLLDALHIYAVDLAGVSMGGEVAGTLAAHFPDRVRTLALFAAAGTRPDTPTALAQRLVAGDNVFHFENAADVNRLIQAIADSGFVVPNVARRAMLTERDRMPQWDTIFHQLIEPAQRYLLDSLASQIRAPTLLVWGRSDPVFALSGARRLAARLPRARLQVLTGCGHLCPVTRANQVADVYLEFLGAPPR